MSSAIIHHLAPIHKLFYLYTLLISFMIAKIA
nr:MAG TPA: hypothetical protein [Caudoviricetes sp.]